MEKDLEQITWILDHLEDIQEDHIQSFNKEVMPDLETQSTQRNTLINQLKQKLSSDFIEKLDDAATARHFRSRISTLLHQNQAIKEKTNRHREGIKKSMKNLSTGRKALNAYTAPFNNRPKVMTFSE